jgi:hypothetical protein
MIRADDALKYAAAKLENSTDWTLDVIGDCVNSHDIEVNGILDIRDYIKKLAALFGHPNLYSDGRVVKSFKEIQYGLTTGRVWHPDPAQDKVTSWRGTLPSDPGVPSPGVYEVTCYPDSQEIHIRVVRNATSSRIEWPEVSV